jgi:hypothetical protein
MRTKILILGLLAVAICGQVAYAEDFQGMDNSAQREMMGEQMQDGPKPGKGGMMKMGPGMMGMMQKDTVVATSDGGVVVMQGPRLIKYDKDLTLVKEVELPRGKGHDHAKHADAEGKQGEAPQPEQQS